MERSKSQQKWNRVISISKSKAQRDFWQTTGFQSHSNLFCCQSPNPHSAPFCWKAVGRPCSNTQNPCQIDNPSVSVGSLRNWYTQWSPASLRMAEHLPADGKQWINFALLLWIAFAIKTVYISTYKLSHIYPSDSLPITSGMREQVAAWDWAACWG